MPIFEESASTPPAEPSPEHPPTVYRSEDYDQIAARQAQVKVVTPPAETKPVPATQAQTKAPAPEQD